MALYLLRKKYCYMLGKCSIYFNCLYVPLAIGEIATPPEIQKDEAVIKPDVEEYLQVPEYNFGVRKSPPLFQKFDVNEKANKLEWCFKRDVVWGCAIYLTDKISDLKTIGPWTNFNKTFAEPIFQRSLLEYLPVITKAPEYPVCKKCLDDLLELLKVLFLIYLVMAMNKSVDVCIISFADEQVYGRLLHIIWKNKEIYKNVIILTGGFHQLRVKQKLIYKRHAYKGYGN